MRETLHAAGTLRLALFTATLVLIVFAPFAGDQVHADDWRIVPTVIAPVCMVFLAFVYPLDMTMTRIFMTDKGGDERTRYWRILALEAGLYVAMLAAWSPFIWRLVNA